MIADKTHVMSLSGLKPRPMTPSSIASQMSQEIEYNKPNQVINRNQSYSSYRCRSLIPSYKIHHFWNVLLIRSSAAVGTRMVHVCIKVSLLCIIETKF